MQGHSSTPKVPLVDGYQDKGTKSAHCKKKYREPITNREIREVMAALANGSALTRRRLSEITDIEISSLCRCLFYLCNRRMSLHVARRAPCPVTGRSVNYYAIRPKLQPQEGASNE